MLRIGLDKGKAISLLSHQFNFTPCLPTKKTKLPLQYALSLSLSEIKAEAGCLS